MRTEIGEAAKDLTRPWGQDLPHVQRWPLVIRRSQDVTHLVRRTPDGLTTEPRVRFGEEAGGWGPLCGDCGVDEGQLHVPGCDMERCPRCGGQLITCGPRQGCTFGREAGFLAPEPSP